MEKGYKILGNYIRLVDERNKNLAVTKLLGVSISKKFIPSIANIVGTDLSNYKIVRTGQFAYGPVTSRNGEKISIAYLDEENCIISSSYTVFEVENKEELDPEYLMLWFSRPEFDRYARYKSHGSVREIFDWNELCMVELPVPDIEKQRKIVKAYKTITDRIDLKQKINDNLLNSVQAIFRSWFVDYDPFDGVCPSNWETGCVEDIAEFFDSMRKPLSSLERADMERIYPYYGAVSIVDYVDDYIFDGEYLLVSEDGIYVVDENGHPLIQHISGKFWANNHAHILKGKAGFNEDSLYLFLANTNMAPIVTGAAQPKINQANLKNFPIMTPDSETMLKFNNIIQPFFDQRLTNESEIKKLEALQSLLLTRLVD
ncbi:restriction endonuclease subunit S [Mediterraneibacter gnavus]|uniref:restriction endonuclease subunit S n=1 Tax=Mediterraneibacter gnavus TaxID=33038 RepID=UPI0032BFFFC4